jgi:hypothetical protein
MERRGIDKHDIVNREISDLVESQDACAAPAALSVNLVTIACILVSHVTSIIVIL